MAQILGTAIEQLPAVGTPPAVAASFPSQSAADSAAQQSRAPATVSANASAPTVAAAAASSEPPSAAATQAAVAAINSEFLIAGKSLELSVDSESDRSVVIVRDTATGAVIGQLPAERVLRLQTLLGNDSHFLIDRTV